MAIAAAMASGKQNALARHGGRIDAAAARWPDAPAPWLDLSTGISPFAWEPPAGLIIDQRALPSPAALAAMEAVAAAAFGADPAHVAAVPGTELGLRLLRDTGLPAPYAHLTPSYATHGEIFPGSRPLDTPEDAAGGTLILANPNNPDGRLLPPDRLIALARRQKAAGGWLIVDEAFADIVPGASIVPHLAPGDPVIVLRSFGKFFGLAGVRLGFVIAPPAVLAGLRARLGDWPVSATAIAYGAAAYADTGWIEAVRRRIADAAAALDAILSQHGFTARGACPLFRLIAHDDAPALFCRLGRAGILSRPFDGHLRWLRLGLPDSDADLARLARALADG